MTERPSEAGELSLGRHEPREPTEGRELSWLKNFVEADIQAIKTKAQQRALSSLPARTPLTQFLRLVRGTDPAHPKPLLTGVARLYRGLGVSMIRSMLTHGLLWTLVDWTSGWIDTRPCERWLAEESLV